jgi:hypothetical protein
MEKGERQSGGSEQTSSREPRASRPAPGKVTRTSKLPPGRGSVQRKAAEPAAGAGTPPGRSAWELTMDPWMDAAHRGVTALAERGQAPVQASGGDLHGFLREGSEAGPLDGGMRAQAEQSLGVDLGGVRVHQGEQSAAASSDLGAKAFTHGQDVVLGAGTPNSLNPVMAHELAHVAQQQGATPGIATKSERGSQGSAYEVDADQAATRIMMSAPARVAQVGAEHVMCFEGAEHMEIGNAAWGGRQVTIGRVTLPAGVFTALQGDFFGTWDEMERACNDNPDLVYAYRDVLFKERDARAAHQRDPANHEEPDSNGPIMVASLLNGRNPMEYLDLAATNFNHFSEQNAESDKLFKLTARDNPAYAAEIAAAQSKFGHNIAQWLQMHLQAGKRAFEDGLANKELGGAGVAMDAAAAHYLTDAFASGHMRVPRMEMFNEYQATFRTAARKQVDSLVNNIPDQIDVSGFINSAASTATGAARQMLPQWANDAIDGAADLATQGANAVGVGMPSLPAMKISLAATKAAIKAKLYPTADSIGNTLGEKIAGFSAKVLHDFDNEHGVKVFNDAGQAWVAKGDHALAASEENAKTAKACTGASAKHIQDLHAAGKAKANDPNKAGLTMPFKSLQPITSLLPQIDETTRNEGTEPGGPRDWHWATMNDEYRGKIKQNAIDSAKGTVASAWQGTKDKAREVIEAKVRQALAALGSFADMVAAQLGAIVEKILSYIPDIDPEILIAAILAV